MATGTGLGLAGLTFFANYLWKTMPEPLAWFGFCVSLVLIAWGLWPLIAPFMGRWRMVSLHDASRMALDAVEGSVLEMAARRQGMSPNGPLCHLATRLFLDGLPVYGKRSPSLKSLPIKNELLFANEFAQDATVVQDTSSHAVTYTDLKVRRKDLNIAIALLKKKYPPSPG